VIRLYLTNVSNTRTFNLVVEGAEVQVVGSDVGMFEWRVPVESIVIAPAERYVVDIRYRESGEFVMLNAVQALDHISATYFAAVDTLGTVVVDASTTADLGMGASRDLTRRVRNESATRDLASVRVHAAREVDHRLELTLRVSDLPAVTEQLMRADRMYFSPVEWEGTMPMMNWASTSGQVEWILRDPDTGKENMEIDWRFSVGEVIRLRVVNDRDAFHAMQHPLHIHGQRFVVLEQDGRRNENLVWKDTVLLPAGSTTDLLLELSNPGVWMVHCHIAEHLESGMKAIFEVTE
jgi:FtsP/CotA-like multicopper oxidase with cupredoxin domain